MKNIWTQHLKRPEAQAHKRQASFSMMLHALTKEKRISENRSKSDIIIANYEEDVKDDFNDVNLVSSEHNVDDTVFEEAIEISRWTAKSQKGYEMNSDEYDDDYVQLLRHPDGQFTMKYYVTGDDVFEMAVSSEEESLTIIAEDNATTSQLYPENPELQWSKNKTNLI